jgi:hypothetical protein
MGGVAQERLNQVGTSFNGRQRHLEGQKVKSQMLSRLDLTFDR